MSLKTRIFNPSSQPINITSNNIINYNNLTISGDAIIDKLLTVNDNTIINGRLDVYNDTSFNNNVDVLGYLNVSGDITSTNINYIQSYINQLKLLLENNSNLKFVNNSNQTFYDIITQQPLRFTSVSQYSTGYNSSPTLITSKKITIEWNYNDILAYNNLTELAELSFLTDLKTKQLPYIDYIVVQIQGYINSIKTDWIDFSQILIPENTIYNQDLYKKITIYKVVENINLDNSLNNILSRNDKFNIRVFGVNNSKLYPSIDSRSLYFNDVNFNVASSPNKPILNISGEQIENNNTIILNYYTDKIEKTNNTSEGLITDYTITYFPLESLRSEIYDLSTNILNIYDLSTSNLNNLGIFSPGYRINQQYVEPLRSIYTYRLNINNIVDTGNYINGYKVDESFNVILYNLISGTKYNYKTKIKNDLSNTYSDETNTRTSEYTMLPDSSNIDISINLNISNNKTFISQKNMDISNNIDNSYVIYINLSDNQSIIPDYLNYQDIEITHPYIDNQEDLSYGFGKFIDNKYDLASLSISINDISKQKIIFDGSFINQSGRNINYNSSTFNYIELKSENSLTDIYKDNSLNKGFRLKGCLKLNEIPNNLIKNIIGDASINPYRLSYKYTRDYDVSYINIDKIYKIYIDDISSQPVLSNVINTSNVNTVLYNMGIPSVKYFDLSFTRNYSNINSQYRYVNGNRIISNIYNINETTADVSKNIILNLDDINSTGNYNYKDIIINSSEYYKNLAYTNSFIESNNTILYWKERVSNLYTENLYDISYSSNHFVDYNSFEKLNNIINKNILDLSLVDLYYINNITKLGNNLLDISLIKYDNHYQQINDSTLMYINGFFQSNNQCKYPSIYDYSYNDLNITNNYNHGFISYDMSGISSSDGYKWIVIKLNKYDNYYKFSDNNSKNIMIKTSHYGYKYIALNDINSFTDNYKLFKDNIIEDLVDVNKDVIGFVTTKYINYHNNPNTYDNKIGNIKKIVSPFTKWIEYGNLYNNMKLTDLINNMNETATRYGCLVYDALNNEYGIYVDSSRTMNELYIYIGIKNL